MKPKIKKSKGAKAPSSPHIDIFPADSEAKPRKYLVVRDTREQQGWTFASSPYCDGTVLKALKTGDYSLVGLEDRFVVERKKSVSEFAKNMLEPRFEREMARLEGFAHAYILCEFTLDDVQRWPLGSGLPPKVARTIKITKYFILKRLMDFHVQYKTKFIFAGIHGEAVMASLFKRINEFYAKT